MLPQVQREISKRSNEQDKKKFGHGVSKAMTIMTEKLSKDIKRNTNFNSKDN